jgi:hypothetical protein
MMSRLVDPGGGGPGQTLIDPVSQQTDLGSGKSLAFLRHRGEFVMGAGGDLDDQRAGAVAGDGGRTMVATLEERSAIIETEIVFRPFGSVAADAAVFKNRGDVAFKIHLRNRRGGGPGAHDGNPRREQKCCKPGAWERGVHQATNLPQERGEVEPFLPGAAGRGASRHCPL